MIFPKILSSRLLEKEQLLLSSQALPLVDLRKKILNSLMTSASWVVEISKGGRLEKIIRNRREVLNPLKQSKLAGSCNELRSRMGKWCCLPLRIAIRPSLCIR